MVSISEYVLLSAQAYYYYRKENIAPDEGVSPESGIGAQAMSPGMAGLNDWSVESYSYTDPVSGFSAMRATSKSIEINAESATINWSSECCP